MEVASTAIRAVRRSGWICSQCRRVSNDSRGRYSAKTSTSTFADNLLAAQTRRWAVPNTPPRSSDLEALEKALKDANRLTNGSTRTFLPPEPTMMDIAAATIKKDKLREAGLREGPSYTGTMLERNFFRIFQSGDVYSPHDLSGAEQRRWGFTQKLMPIPKVDVVDRLGVDFMKEYKNFSIMQEFLTSGGRILPGNKTGLRPKNQRKLARAVRRAAGLGLIPKTYTHPELLIRSKRR